MDHQEKNPYKIIFTDIDGTLLDSESRLPEQTALFLRRLNREEQFPVILVSARMPAGMRGIREELGVKSPMVCYGGGYIVDEKENCIFSQTLDEERVELLLQVIEDFPGISINVYSYDKWYVYQKDSWVFQEEKITGLTASVIIEYLEPFHGVHKILCMGEADRIKNLEARIRKDFDVAVCRSKPTYLEIMSKKVSKGTALAVLGEYYKVGREEMVAFGDGENDIEMLRYAGTGVAMENAAPELKEMADVIAKTNDEEGLRQYLEGTRHD